MSSDVSIRRFRPSDQQAVRQLVLGGLGDHFGFIDESLNPDLDDITQHYADNGAEVLVADIDGSIVGTGTLIAEGPATGRLVRMSVDGRYRGRGIGRSMVMALIEVARQRGYRSLLVETNDDWFDAIGLYEACGFIEFDRRDGDVHLVLKLE